MCFILIQYELLNVQACMALGFLFYPKDIIWLNPSFGEEEYKTEKGEERMLFTAGGNTDFMWSFMWHQNKMPHKAAASPAAPQGTLLIALYIKFGTVCKMTQLYRPSRCEVAHLAMHGWGLTKNLSPLPLLINITAVNVVDSFLSLETQHSS